MRPSERVLELFVPMMEREGYLYRKLRSSFEKTFPEGKCEYFVGFDGRGGLVTAHAGFFVHFNTLEHRFEQALGQKCTWSAGATLLNAGADPGNFFLFEMKFAAMSPKERSGIPSEVIHPKPKIDAAVHFLGEAHARFARPFFQRLQTYRQLADFYLEYIRSGFSGRCRPYPENLICLSLLVAEMLGDDAGEIVASAKGVKSNGHDLEARVQAVRNYIESVKQKQNIA